jgi:hypothetical protein
MSSTTNQHFRGMGEARGRYVTIMMLVVIALGSLFISHYLRRFVFLFPLLLSAFWLIATPRKEHIKNPGGLLPLPLLLTLACYLLFLLAASLFSPYRIVAMRELLLTLLGVMFIAFWVGRVMQRGADERLVVLALVGGGVLLAATDVVQYANEFAATGRIAKGVTHRWLTSGYILYSPFLLLFRDTLRGRSKVVFNMGLFLFFLLAASTGARTAWGTIVLQIVVLGVLTRQRQYLIDLTMFCAAIAIGLFALPHEIGMASIEKGVGDDNRINGHWLPAIHMSMQSLAGFLFGHGFGTEVTVPPQFSGQPTPLLAGAHNVFLQALLAGGVVTLASLAWLFTELGRVLWRCRDSQSEPLKILALGGFVSFTGFFLIAGQVGDPRPEPLALFVLIAILLHRSKSAVQPSLHAHSQ